LELEEV